jgi:hypothetical protein
MPVITLCYIRQRTVSDGTEYSRRIAKFGLFLLSGNIMNVTAGVFSPILSLRNGEAGIIITLCLISISTIPTPFVVLWFMKPVRKNFRSMVTFKYLKKMRKEMVPSHTSNTPSTPE